MYLLQYSDGGMIVDRRAQVSVMFIGTRGRLHLNHLGIPHGGTTVIPIYS